jgi:hypothetical protein
MTYRTLMVAAGLVALALLASALAGCGGGGDDPTDSHDATTQPVNCTSNPRACT